MLDSTIEHSTVCVGGFDTIITTRAGLASMMVRQCKWRRKTDLPKLVFSSNGQGVSLAGQNKAFADVMLTADVIHADGMPIVFASQLLTHTPLPERIATTDFFHDAVIAAIQNGLSFFMLGGTEEQNVKVVDAIGKTYPDLKIAGRHHGYFDPSDDKRICDLVCASGADVLWVGMGKPLQEFWSSRNRENLRGVGWVKTCGGLYGYLTGEEKRAPLLMQRMGLEWFYRVMQQPKRLGWRYLVSNPHSVYRLLVHSS